MHPGTLALCKHYIKLCKIEKADSPPHAECYVCCVCMCVRVCVEYMQGQCAHADVCVCVCGVAVCLVLTDTLQTMLPLQGFAAQ